MSIRGDKATVLLHTIIYTTASQPDLSSASGLV